VRKPEILLTDLPAVLPASSIALTPTWPARGPRACPRREVVLHYTRERAQGKDCTLARHTPRIHLHVVRTAAGVPQGLPRTPETRTRDSR
jgi:hypothetical protein